MKKALLTILITTLFSGCGVFKKMDQMGKDTSSMSQTTQKMSGDMEAMNNKLDQVSGTAQSTDQKMGQLLFRPGRHGGTLGSRNDIIAKLRNEESLAIKVGAAVEYFAALEYQYYVPSVEEEKTRDELLTEGVSGLFRLVLGYLDGEDPDPKKWPTDPSTDDQNKKNNLALSLGMHKIDDQQVTFGQHYGFEAFSILDFIKDGLQKLREMHQTIDSADELSQQIASMPLALKALSEQERVAIYLLQLRFSALAGLGLTDLKPSGWKDKFFIAKTGKKDWDPHFDRLSPAEIQYRTSLIRKAIELRDFLWKIGEGTQAEGPVWTFYRKMKFEGFVPARGKLSGNVKNQVTKEYGRAVLDLIEPLSDQGEIDGLAKDRRESLPQWLLEYKEIQNAQTQTNAEETE